MGDAHECWPKSRACASAPRCVTSVIARVVSVLDSANEMSPDFSDRDVQDRWLAVRAARDRRDVPYLIGALRDPDHRAMAAGYIADLEAFEAVPDLLRLLDARDPHVRASAAKAIGDLRATEALRAVREIAVSDEEDFVRSWAVGAVGKIAGTDETEFLINFLQDPSMRVRAAAARSRTAHASEAQASEVAP